VSAWVQEVNLRKCILPLVLVLAAFAINLWFNLCWVGVEGNPGYDYFRYKRTADQMLQGQTHSYKEAPFTFWLFALVNGTSGGENKLALRLIYSFMGALTVLAIYGICSLIAGERTAFFGACVAALNLHTIYYNSWLMTETPLGLFFTSSVFFFLLAVRHRSHVAAALAGISLGLAIFAKPVPALFLLATPFLLLLYSSLDRRRSLELSATLLGCALLTVLPYVVKARLETGEWFLVSKSAGETLFVGNLGGYKYIDNPGFFSPDEFQRLHALPPHEFDKMLGNRAVDYLKKHPRVALAVLGDKLRDIFGLWLPSRHSSLPDVFAQLQYWVILAFCAAGMILRRCKWRTDLVVYVAVVNVFASCMIFWAGPRMRYPAEQFMAVFAGVGLLWLLGKMWPRLFRSTTEP
jgi:hypothetical protein